MSASGVSKVPDNTAARSALPAAVSLRPSGIVADACFSVTRILSRSGNECDRKDRKDEDQLFHGCTSSRAAAAWAPSPAGGPRRPAPLEQALRDDQALALGLNVHAGHDDYHCVDDTGFIQVMAKDAQGAADLNLIMRKTAELSLTPAIVGQVASHTSRASLSSSIVCSARTSTPLRRDEKPWITVRELGRILGGGTAP